MNEYEIKKPRVGNVIEGEVVQVTKDEVFVDVGYLTEGTIDRDNLGLEKIDDARKVCKEGDKITVKVKHFSEKDGVYTILLSRKDLLLKDKYSDVYGLMKERKHIPGKVTQEKEDFYIVQIEDVYATLPKDEIFMKNDDDIIDLVGKTIDVQVMRVDTRRREIIVSQKIVEKKRFWEKRKEEFATFEVGQLVTGKVVRLFDKYAFINLGFNDAILRIDEASHYHIKNMNEIFEIGQDIDVKIINVNSETNKMEVSHKQAIPTPYENFVSKHQIGEVLEGNVVKMFEYGFLVEVEPRVAGLVHVSEYSYDPYYKVEENIQENQKIAVKLIGIDEKKGRISLSIKRLEKDPWEDLDVYRGDIVKGKVAKFLERGALLNVGEVQGFLPTNQISANRITKAEDVLSIDQEIEVFITRLDKYARKMELSVNRIKEEEEREQYEEYLDSNKIESVTMADVFGEKLSQFNVESAEKSSAPRKEDSSDNLENKLNKMKVAELKELASDKGIELDSKAKKSDIIEAIIANQ